MEIPDTTGLFLLDHVADIGSNAPEKRSVVAQVFQSLHKLGYRYSSWSINVAIQSHNHTLLRWLMHQQVSTGVSLAQDKLTWAAIHSRNRVALAFGWLDAEHFEEIALQDDTQFLGHMRTILCKQKNTDPIEISSASFSYMILDEMDAGEAGFRWLLRAGMVDMDSLTVYQLEALRARYSKHTPACLLVQQQHHATT